MKEETRSQRIRSASAERRARQKAELRRVILDAATTLFEEHGYENFSLRQVAESIGYSATTIYLHFEDKDDLALAIGKSPAATKAARPANNWQASHEARTTKAKTPAPTIRSPFFFWPKARQMMS